MPFLDDLARRPLGDLAGLPAEGLFIGSGQLGLEVAVYRSDARPTAALLQEAWRERRAGRSTPVLVVVRHAGAAWLAGPSGEDLPVHSAVDLGTAERLCLAALDQPDRHAALLFLAQAMPSLETRAPGLRNEGLFALHELTEDVPRRPEWADHTNRSRAILAARPAGQELLQRLGFNVERLDNMTQLLRGADRRLALAVLLDRTDNPEAGSPRFGNLSPVSYALSKADNESLDWVVVIQDDRLRLYPTRSGVGVGGRGRTETYIEIQTSVLSDDRIGYLTLLFSADALQENGSVQTLLQDSRRFASSLADRLRDRIYDHVMPALAQGVVQARNLTAPTAVDLDLTYQMALTILFRLLFVAYAEDKDLLPYNQSEAYRRRSLKQKAQELAEHVRGGVEPTAGTSHWDEVVRIWNAIERGDAEISVPAYNGGLFTRDRAVSQAGAALAGIQLPNAIFEPALRELLLSDVGDDGLQPVDFRSLGVREFGTIYEGLLESELSVAEQDLMLDNRGSYVPVRGQAVPVVETGEIYLHNRSGARKASGSYFTKSFAVEHLLDRALVPALEDHLARVAAMNEADAAEAFFDFRVADIAMGSGHFLVAAVDRIECAFTDYLAGENAPGAAGVRNELGRLREAARGQLRDMADQMAFEDSQLLRRLIARRCIYGVDQNPLSVQLARLAMWIHTFVPGLPLSVLDHNLVHGNSLVGVGTVREIEEKFEAAGMAMFPVDAHTLLSAAAQPLRRLANLADSTLPDVQAAREAMEQAKLAVADTKALCDIITAQRLDASIPYQFENWERDRGTIQRSEVRRLALNAVEGLGVFHFPIAFPEVFLRQRSGFDVLLGNPPWEKARVEEHEFWSRHFPGLRGLPTAQKNARIDELKETRPDLLIVWEAERQESERTRDAVRHLPGMATGHPDLFRAFLWRFNQLTANDKGRLAIVLPGDAFKIKGGATLRADAVNQFDVMEVSFLTNKAEWVFERVDPRKLIALFVAVRGSASDCLVRLTPEAHSKEGWENRSQLLTEWSRDWLANYSESWVLPTLVSATDDDVLNRMMESPAIRGHGEIVVRRVYADFETTRDKGLYHDAMNEGDWPVYGGQSFDLWNPDRGPNHYYSFTRPSIIERANERRLRSPLSSPYGGTPLRWRQDPRTHPILRPRLVFRDVSNRTNTRTLLIALAPPNVVTVQTAPWVLFLDPNHQVTDEAFLLGVLASRVCDWWMRRFVEGHVDEEAFNSIRVPLRTLSPPLARRTVALAGRLAAVDERFAEWAAEVGVDYGPLPPDAKQDMIDELDAVVARLYGLSEDQLTHIFETFHEGWDYQPRLEAVLAHFRRLVN